jgi:antitoxin HigA-1
MGHPGEFLRFLLFEEEMLVHDAAQRTGLTVQEIGDLLAGRLPVTAEIAAKLAKLGGTKADMWLGMQTDYDRVR